MVSDFVFMERYMFDARKYRESLQKPTYIDVDADGNEVRFEGEIVSFNKVAEFIDEFTNLEGKTEADINALIKKVLVAVKMDVKALDYIVELPVAGRLEAVLSFFECLRGVKRS